MLEYYMDDKRHLVCYPYSIQNLHMMADDLEIKRCWYHATKGLEHYDIPKRRDKEFKRNPNIKKVSASEIVKIIKKSFNQ